MGGVVTTTHGKLQGTADGDVYRFLGVPFAAPVSGGNRLRPPQPVVPWNGVRDATRFRPAPPQVAPPEVAGAGWDTDLVGEDCLSLNVWTPDLGAVALPVMLWIQGGQFEFGATAAYDGSRFARDGVVCVTMNWRVGADGFAFLGDGDANLGLLDQVAALEWVQQNIAAFGGDPGNVTVFGESAGAMCIGVLLGMPRVDGLFRRAILQSGAAHHVLPAESARRVGGHLARKLGVRPSREALAAVPVESLLAAQAELKAELLADPDPDRWGREVVASLMLFQPVVDGEVLPAPPLERVAAGGAWEVDLLVGTNTEDWRLFLAISGLLGQVDEGMLMGPLRRYGYLSLAAYDLPATALGAYRSRYPGAAPGDLVGPLLGPNPPQELADTMHAAWVAFAGDGDPGWPRYGERDLWKGIR